VTLLLLGNENCDCVNSAAEERLFSSLFFYAFIKKSKLQSAAKKCFLREPTEACIQRDAV